MMAASMVRCSLVVVECSHSPGRRVSDRVVCTISRWPMSLEANCDVPPCSLAEQRRMSEFPQFSTMVSAAPLPYREAKKKCHHRADFAEISGKIAVFTELSVESAQNHGNWVLQCGVATVFDTIGGVEISGEGARVIPRFCALSLNSQLQQEFIGDAFLPPHGILVRHPANQGLNLNRNRRSAGSGLQPPE
jgi:hypothetical protein